MAANFYTVKTIFRCFAAGRPDKPDQFFDPDATLVEERIQLVKAKSKEEAQKKAEKDANEYAKRVKFFNPYNQAVTLEYTGLCEVYEIERALSDMTEIYSNSKVMDKKITISKIAHVYLNKKQPYNKSKRKKFINREYFHA
ncbi:MAG: DUF4288 domain-containing protein [Candidatus Omnitrophota bacterium]